MAGIGVLVQRLGGQVTVVDLVEGGPAALSGELRIGQVRGMRMGRARITMSVDAGVVMIDIFMSMRTQCQSVFCTVACSDSVIKCDVGRRCTHVCRCACPPCTFPECEVCLKLHAKLLCRKLDGTCGYLKAIYLCCV